MKKIIGIVGIPGAGKDTVAIYLRDKYNIPFYSISDFIRIIAKEKGLEENRNNLINLGIEYRKKYSDSYFIEEIIKRFDGNEMTIIGMRKSGEVEYLKDNYDFVLIGIKTKSKVLLDRIVKRGKLGDPKNLDELNKLIEKGNKDGLEEKKCMEMADYIIENNGSVEELYNEIDKIITKIKKPK